MICVSSTLRICSSSDWSSPMNWSSWFWRCVMFEIVFDASVAASSRSVAESDVSAWILLSRFWASSSGC